MTDTNKTPNEIFVDNLHKLVAAVVGEQMAKNGVIGQYPEKYIKEIKEVKKELMASWPVIH